MVSGTFGPDTAPTWQRYAPIYEQVAIMGMTMEWIPNNLAGQTTWAGGSSTNKTGIVVTGLFAQDINDIADLQARSTATLAQ